MGLPEIGNVCACAEAAKAVAAAAINNMWRNFMANPSQGSRGIGAAFILGV
jgi:hypothetical protein